MTGNGRFGGRRSWHGLTVLAVAASVLVVGPAPASNADHCAPVQPPAAAPSTLTVDAAQVSLDAGGSADLDLDLDVGIRPVPVDVWFVIDLSRSMADAHASLRDSLAAEAANMAALGYDLRLGAAGFVHADHIDSSRVYKVLHPLGQPDCHFGDQVREPALQGQDEPHLFALLKSVTGAASEDLNVPAGGAAGFRPDVHRLVVHATDSVVKETVRGAPTFDTVTQAYRSNNVRHIGLQVISERNRGFDVAPDEQVAPTRATLDRLSAGTNALATGLGLDCDGNGLPDVGAGEPIVCEFDTSSLALGAPAAVGTIVRQVIESLEASLPVEIATSGTDGLKVEVDGADGRIDPREGGSLAGALRLTCPTDATGSEHTATVVASLGGAVLDQAEVVVTCGVPAEVVAVATPQPGAAPPPPPPAPGAAPAPLPAAQPIAAPAAPAPVPAPAAAAQGVPAQATQVAPQIGIAPGAEQVEVAHQDSFRDSDEKPGGRPMLASRRNPAPSPAVTWLAGVMLLIAMAAANHRATEHVRAD